MRLRWRRPLNEAHFFFLFSIIWVFFLFLFYFRGRFRCCGRRSFTWLLDWRDDLLQPGDSVFQFAVQSLVLGEQAGVACLQQVQRARHALYLLFHLFWVRALCCHLQDRRGQDSDFWLRWNKGVLWFYLQVQQSVFHQNLPSFLLQHSFSIRVLR